jgi:uncharacterized membrane protein YcjF (UPF0283 family)
MSTGAIIAIVVAAIIIIALLALVVPRMRARAAERRRERELQQRRAEEADRHRSEAESRTLRADEAEQRARIAAKEADAERAQAEAHEARATMHDRGLADDELTPDRDRDRLGGREGGRFDRDDDRTVASTAPASDYERGRRDEALDEERRET